MLIKNGRLIYSDFVSNRPEPTSLFELWCMLGGVANLFIVMGLSSDVISNTPSTSVLFSLFIPAVFFCMDYLSKEVSFLTMLLRATIVFAMVYCIYALLFPEDTLRPDVGAYISIFIFCFIALILHLIKWTKN